MECLIAVVQKSENCDVVQRYDSVQNEMAVQLVFGMTSPLNFNQDAPGPAWLQRFCF